MKRLRIKLEITLDLEPGESAMLQPPTVSPKRQKELALAWLYRKKLLQCLDVGQKVGLLAHYHLLADPDFVEE